MGGDARGSRVIVLAGCGGNGGGGLTAARRLSIWGADVSVVLGASRSEFEGVPRHQLDIVERLPVLAREAPFDEMEDALRSADLILDALIGYSLRGAPREPIASVIRAANASRTPLLALDIPSGLNGDTGEVCDPTIRAVATLTLALPKAGLTRRAAAAWVGDLYLADISVPDAVMLVSVSVSDRCSRAARLLLCVPAGDEECVSEFAGSDRVRRTTRHRFRLLKIHAARELCMLDPCHDLRHEQSTLHQADHFSERVVVVLHMRHVQSGGLQALDIVRHWLCVGETRDPAGVPVEFHGWLTVAR